MSKFRFMVALPVAIGIWIAIKVIGIIDDSSLDYWEER